jgi:hypothetical protein
MARLAGIASEVGSATSLPKQRMIPQKPQSDQGRSDGWTLRTLSATLHAVSRA